VASKSLKIPVEQISFIQSNLQYMFPFMYLKVQPLVVLDCCRFSENQGFFSLSLSGNPSRSHWRAFYWLATVRTPSAVMAVHSLQDFSEWGCTTQSPLPCL